jgi:hypothetical protein
VRVRRGIDRWTLGAAAVTVGLGVLSAGLPALATWGPATGRGELRLHLDVVEENDPPTWWATAVLVLAATSCALVAALHERGADRRRWAVLAVLVTLLSLDETTSLHERLDRLAGPVAGTGFPFVRLVPGGVLGAVLVAAVGALLRSAPRSTRRWLLAGLGVLPSSALGGELVQGLLLADGSTGPAHVLTHHAEEAGETSGAVAVLRGAAGRIGVVRAGAGWAVAPAGRPTPAGPVG